MLGGCKVCDTHTALPFYKFSTFLGKSIEDDGYSKCVRTTNGIFTRSPDAILVSTHTIPVTRNKCLNEIRSLLVGTADICLSSFSSPFSESFNPFSHKLEWKQPFLVSNSITH